MVVQQLLKPPYRSLKQWQKPSCMTYMEWRITPSKPPSAASHQLPTILSTLTWTTRFRWKFFPCQNRVKCIPVAVLMSDGKSEVPTFQLSARESTFSQPMVPSTWHIKMKLDCVRSNKLLHGGLYFSFSHISLRCESKKINKSKWLLLLHEHQLSFRNWPLTSTITLGTRCQTKQIAHK